MATVVAVHSFRGGIGKSNTTEIADVAVDVIGGEAVAAGRPSPAAVDVDGLPNRDGAFKRFSDIATATVVLPPGSPEELEAWVHRVARDGDSDPVPATVTRDGSTIRVSPTHA